MLGFRVNPASDRFLAMMHLHVPASGGDNASPVSEGITQTIARSLT